VVEKERTPVAVTVALIAGLEALVIWYRPGVIWVATIPRGPVYPVLRDSWFAVYDNSKAPAKQQKYD
jgi:hypothetical protein